MDGCGRFDLVKYTKTHCFRSQDSLRAVCSLMLSLKLQLQLRSTMHDVIAVLLYYLPLRGQTLSAGTQVMLISYHIQQVRLTARRLVESFSGAGLLALVFPARGWLSGVPGRHSPGWGKAGENRIYMMRSVCLVQVFEDLSFLSSC